MPRKLRANGLGIVPLFLFCLWVLLPSPADAVTSARLIPDDQIARPGEEAWLRVRLVRSPIPFITRPVSGERVEFYQGKTLLGVGLTGGDGIATVRFVARSPGLYPIKARLDASSSYAAEQGDLVLAAWPPDRSFLLIEVNSLEDVPETELPLPPFLIENPAPRPGATDVVKRLSARYPIVYLTTEDRFLQRHTWLSHHRFPPGPLLSWDGSANLIRKWEKEGRHPKAGITRSNASALIFHENGIRSILLVSPKEKKSEGEKGVLRPSDWEGVERLLR